MTCKCTAQTNQQQKSEKPQASGILQRAAVRSVSDARVQSTDDQEAQPLSNLAFSKDFSRVPINTTKPQQIMARNLQCHSMSSIQAKLTIGEPNDRYEQEADRVASQVVQRINAPASAGQSVQRQEEAEEEIQAKPEIISLQRRSKPKEELQAKLTLQRREEIAGGEASTDLTSAINSERGGGQAIADNIRQPMEQAFGEDFSGVKVHTDGQSDQLNRSIQARAFTTGQDVFFRQGEYNPGSRGGQELLAHELTHVVQQNGGAVQRSQQQGSGKALKTAFNTRSVVQRMLPRRSQRPSLPSSAPGSKKEVLAGHGQMTNGSFKCPDGIRITFFTGPECAIDDAIGVAIENREGLPSTLPDAGLDPDNDVDVTMDGQQTGSSGHRRTFHGGDTVPDYILSPPTGGLNVQPDSTTVAVDTKLSALAKQRSGKNIHLYWAACTANP
ncbi:eCIS core domain-containing protein [Nostoc sp.]|uniref:eCIS core domain-containing protein n=1 Tax=Nostoc sp. TaxID=1180 RepID=UPI002FF30B94